MGARAVWEEAMRRCMRDDYTDDCEECREEFTKCLRRTLAMLN